MPIIISWITPKHIIRLTFTGNVTFDDLAKSRSDLATALKEIRTRLDYVLDLRELEQVTEKVLQFILSKDGSLRSIKTGCLAVVGGTEQQRLIVGSAALALHINIGYFDDEHEALEFIAESTAD